MVVRRGQWPSEMRSENKPSPKKRDDNNGMNLGPPPAAVRNKAPGISTHRKIELGERRQLNVLIAEGVQAALREGAKKAGMPMGLFVEEAILEKLDLVCESCGR